MNKKHFLLASIFCVFGLLSCSTISSSSEDLFNSLESSASSEQLSSEDNPSSYEQSSDISDEPSQPSVSSEPSSEETSSETPSLSEQPSSEQENIDEGIFDKYYLSPTGEPMINEQLGTINPLGDISSVWNYYRGDKVKVAVIDSGFDINHPDFKNKDGSTAISDDSVNISFVNNQINKRVGKNNVIITDGDSHGTMCAGLLGARVNGYGMTGIAPNVELMLIKVDKHANSIAEGFKYAADNGAKVVSISLGAYPSATGSNSGDIIYPAGSDLSTVFNDEINYAYSKGVTIVAATGNDKNTKLSYPAGCANVIGAGGLAKGSNTKIWDNGYEGSNYNGNNVYVDCFAPSEGIVAPGFDTSKNSSTYWSDAKGTSFAAPIIAGAAAIFFQKYPNATNKDFEISLKNSCTNISSYNNGKNMGYGALNFAKLLNINDDFKQIDADYTTSTSMNVTKLNVIDEAGWNFRTLHLWGLSFKEGYGYKEFENFLTNEYGSRTSTSSYSLEGTKRTWAYTDEGYIGDYYLCIGNTDHAKATNYEYIFPTYVTSFSYQIVNNSNWLPEGGHKVSSNYIGNEINMYFWYKGDADTGTVQVESNTKAYKNFKGNRVTIYEINGTKIEKKETKTISYFEKFTYSKDLYIDSRLTKLYTPSVIRKSISLYYGN